VSTVLGAVYRNALPGEIMSNVNTNAPASMKSANEKSMDSLEDTEILDEAMDSEESSSTKPRSQFDLSSEEEAREMAALEKEMQSMPLNEDEDDMASLDEINNILDLPDQQFPKFTLAKNKARFLRMVSWYRGKEEWIEVAPLSGVTKLFKQQTKELEGIRSSKMDYEMELETGTLTPSQRSYRRDELKMCKVQEKMAVHLISKLQLKIKSGRR
jgi:hypothetical protein